MQNRSLIYTFKKTPLFLKHLAQTTQYTVEQFVRRKNRISLLEFKDCFNRMKVGKSVEISNENLYMPGIVCCTRMREREKKKNVLKITQHYAQISQSRAYTTPVQRVQSFGSVHTAELDGGMDVCTKYTHTYREIIKQERKFSNFKENKSRVMYSKVIFHRNAAASSNKEKKFIIQRKYEYGERQHALEQKYQPVMLRFI